MFRPMISMTFALALVAAPPLAAQGLPVGQPAQLGLSAGGLARIDSLFRSYVDQEKAPGVVAMVARHGQVVWSGTYGMADREAARPMTADALFRIASESKPVTSVAAMMLVDDGRLGLDDPVSRYIPTFATARVAVATDSGRILEPARHAITVRQLLTQTAGLSYGYDPIVRSEYQAAGLGPAAGYGWYLADKSEPVCNTMERLGTLPLVAQPGEAWVYGYATDVLGCVVERAGGMPLDQFLAQRIFAPLGMRDTWFFPPDSVGGRLAAVYAVTPEGALVRAPDGAMGQGDYIHGPRQDVSGGAGLVSTAADYGRFLQMLLDGGQVDGTRLLSPSAVSLMTTGQVGSLYPVPGMDFGYGFEILENPEAAATPGAPGRFAWAGAYGTTFWVDPAEGLIGVLMLQALPRRGLDLAGKFRTMVYASLLPTPKTTGH